MLEGLTPAERTWIVADEERWRRAFRLSERNAGIDPGGVYRVLRNLEKTPTERLRNALGHGRLFRAHSP